MAGNKGSARSAGLSGALTSAATCSNHGPPYAAVERAEVGEKFGLIPNGTQYRDRKPWPASAQAPFTTRVDEKTALGRDEDSNLMVY